MLIVGSGVGALAKIVASPDVEAIGNQVIVSPNIVNKAIEAERELKAKQEAERIAKELFKLPREERRRYGMAKFKKAKKR